MGLHRSHPGGWLAVTVGVPGELGDVGVDVVAVAALLPHPCKTPSRQPTKMTETVSGN
jgi:hypothetical protein